MKAFVYVLSIFSIITVFTVSGYLQYKLPKTTGINDSLNMLLTNDVDVYYDQFGIPHINAKNISDAYKTFGYVIASQRLFQMDVYRRVVSGTLSEVFGNRTVQADKLMRKLQIKKNGLRQLQHPNLSEEAKLIMNSYLAGVHQFIEEGPLPVEFDLLGYIPQKFELLDLMAMSGYMALTFAEGVTGDILNAKLIQTLADDKLEIIRTGASTDYNYFNSQKTVQSNILKSFHSSLAEIKSVFPLFHGSNSWVLSGSRTKSGKPILANDPHMATSNPHIFFEAHIKVDNYEIYGNFIPLIPFAVMGHTPYSAWGVTMAELDDLNIYDEKIHTEDKTKVMYLGEWVDIESSSEIIKIKDSDDITIEVSRTPHGPILSGSKYEIKGRTLALNWSVNHPDNNIVQALYEIPLAKTVANLKQAVSHGAAPGLNISWVNSDGDIAWWVLGKFPKLPDGVESDIVLNGADGTNEVERYYTIDENPHVINPESGVISTANYKPQQAEFSHFDGYWQPGGRFFRIEELLSKKDLWTVEDLKKIQTDSVIPILDKMKKQFAKAINLKLLSNFEKEVYKNFQNWDGNTLTTSVGSSIYHYWNYYNIRNAFVDELGEEDFIKFGRTADFWHSYKKILFSLKHSFWDNIKTDRVESGVDIITHSFKSSVKDLREKFGDDISRWKWGKLHSAEYIHPLGNVKPFNYFFNIGPIEANGGRYVINNLGHKKHTKDFRVVHGPATRRLVDMSNPRSTLGIMPTGNSGNFLSQHFDDQLKLYHSGKYRAQEMNWDLLEKMKLLKFTSKK
jgi:penicillin amidase